MRRRKNMIARNLMQTIRRSLGRYIAIMAIVALGAGLFCGLRVTKVDMIATVQKYTDRQNMFDLQVMNSYGWTPESVEVLSGVPGIADAEGSISIDALMHFDEGDASPFKLISIPKKVNQVSLKAGRMPEADNECVIDGYFFGRNLIGQQIHVSRENASGTLDNLAYDSYTIVGLVNTPLYLNMQRGSTTIGSGSLSGFLYVPRDGFSLEFFTEINLTLVGDYAVYSEEYNDAMDEMGKTLESVAQVEADKRLEVVRTEAEEEYAKGRQEYLDGMAEYRKERADALQELAQAEKDLIEGEKTLEESRLQIEEAWPLIESGQAAIDAGWAELTAGEKELEQAKKDAYAQMDAAQAELDAGYAEAAPQLESVNAQLAQIGQVLSPIDSGIAELRGEIAQIDLDLGELALTIAGLDASIKATEDTIRFLELFGTAPQELVDKLAQLQSERAEASSRWEYLTTARLAKTARLTALETERAQAALELPELLITKAALDYAMEQIQDGYAQLEAGRAEAEAQFSAAEEELRAGRQELTQAQATLDANRFDLEEGEKELERGEKEIADGWEKYYSGKAEAEEEFAKAEAELADGRQELADARELIEGMDHAELYVLSRNTNLGYVVFEGDSNIVAGVAKIFPVFFLAVAALVCVTTMTRMIDEERTQIGTLKALGYGPGAIMSKYMGYSGTASLAGCLLGLALGLTFFPVVIWYAYGIMYDFSSQLTLSYDPFSIVFIFLSYTGLIEVVTWYCCRRALAEVPAELIRPKPPVVGKQIFLEKLPVWKRLSFLNKVAIRNIFRYRQRLAMMMLGIGGCTALLVTGFGLKDSVSDIVSYQFETVTLYDIGLTFNDHQDQEAQDAFREDHPDQKVLFCYQGGIDVEFDDKVKNVYFIAADQNLRGFIDLHLGDKQVAMPRKGEALISIGAATSMGIDVGDTVTLRNADLEELEVRVSGIYDNNVYNYAIVHCDTIRDQWGREPEIQSAFVVAGEGQNLQELGHQLSGADGVISMSINQDLAETVGGMMDALDAIILVVVGCAGALAGIVLYNLTNINIQERIREIATIKVLGFNAAETASYVFKENLTLTVIGTLVGLIGGKGLHALVMSYVRIDMVWFANRVNPQSYVLSAVLTILAAVIVDFIMYFRLEKINMAEALKSVE
ncbi:MAG: FtsX-like permease family protein [Oscillospiraceae bacterium]|nr:FtsX-like permease family protein [Oscillospiraceae bacterium]